MASKDFEIAIATWNFGTMYKNRGITLVEIAQRVHDELAVEYIDLFDAHFHPAKDLLDMGLGEACAYAEDLRDQLAEVGVKVAAISAINDFASYGERANTEKRLRMWLEIAPILDARFIRLSTEKWWLVDDGERTVFDGEALGKHLVELAHDAPDDWDGFIVLENHPLDVPLGEAGNRYINEMIKAVAGHKRLALCPDDGHMLYDTEEEWARKLSRMFEHAKYVDLKCGEGAFSGPKPSWDTRLKLLRTIDVERPLFLNLEHVGPDDSLEALTYAISRIRHEGAA